MPNIYYCQADNQGVGVLRAVLSWEQANGLLKLHPVKYVGRQFPSSLQGRKTDFALLRVSETESDQEWRTGFYTFDADVTAVESAIQTYAVAAIEVGAKQQSHLAPEVSRSGTLMEEPPITSNSREVRSRSKWILPKAVWRWLVAPRPNRVQSGKSPRGR